MSLRKIAKNLSRTTGEDIEEVYERLVKNRKKIRKMEGDVYAENYTERSEYYDTKALDK